MQLYFPRNADYSLFENTIIPSISLYCCNFRPRRLICRCRKTRMQFLRAISCQTAVERTLTTFYSGFNVPRAVRLSIPPNSRRPDADFLWNSLTPRFHSRLSFCNRLVRYINITGGILFSWSLSPKLLMLQAEVC